MVTLVEVIHLECTLYVLMVVIVALEMVVITTMYCDSDNRCGGTDVHGSGGDSGGVVGYNCDDDSCEDSGTDIGGRGVGGAIHKSKGITIFKKCRAKP